MAVVILSAAAFVVALVTSFATSPLTSRIARRFGILDRPESARYKHQPAAVPYLGGLAIMLGLLGGWLVAVVAESQERPVSVQVLSLAILAGVGLGLVGLIDDLRSVPRLVRLAAQLVAAGCMWIAGFQVGFASIEILNIALTLLWLVGITNAFNLLDNMDGLTSGLAGLAAMFFGVMSILGDLPILPLVAFALSGACFGFLMHNRHPAKIFMGDAGSTFIGFLLATLGLQVRFDNLPEVTFLIPVVVLSLPILDTTLVVVSRLKNGRPVFAGGRDHISHRLVNLGLSVRLSVGILYWAQICLGWLGLVVSQSSVKVGLMLLGFVVALGFFFLLCLLSVPAYQEEFRDERSFLEARRRGGVEYEEAIDNSVEAESSR